MNNRLSFFSTFKYSTNIYIWYLFFFFVVAKTEQISVIDSFLLVSTYPESALSFVVRGKENNMIHWMNNPKYVMYINIDFTVRPPVCLY